MVEEIRVVMFGKTGNGKSYLGNNILGKNVFYSDGCSQSVTGNSEQGERMIDKHCNLLLVDTPGLFDTSVKDNMKTAKILMSTVKKTKPGPHIFIFVLTIGRFTEEEQATAEFLKDLFGEHVINYLIIVFTGKDTLDFHNRNLESYIKSSGDALKSIVGQCQGRMAINNRASREEVIESVNTLLQMIKRVYLKNEKQHYTDKMLMEADIIFKEKLRQHEEEAHRRERELEAEMKEKDRMFTEKMKEFKKYQDEQNLKTKKLQEQHQANIQRQKEESYKKEVELQKQVDLANGEKNRIAAEKKSAEGREIEMRKEAERANKEKNEIIKQKEADALRENKIMREKIVEAKNDTIEVLESKLEEKDEELSETKRKLRKKDDCNIQ